MSETPTVGKDAARVEVDRVARLLMASWEKAEGKPVNTSYVATFADMARAVLVDRQAEQIERWEYCTVDTKSPTTRGEVRMMLDEYGDRGWELVTTEYGWWIFKRRLLGPKPKPAEEES